MASFYELVVQLNGQNNIMLDKQSDNDNRGDAVKWSGSVSAEGCPSLSAWHNIQISVIQIISSLCLFFSHWSQSRHFCSKWLCKIIEQLFTKWITSPKSEVSLWTHIESCLEGGHCERLSAAFSARPLGKWGWGRTGCMPFIIPCLAEIF